MTAYDPKDSPVGRLVHTDERRMVIRVTQPKQVRPIYQFFVRSGSRTRLPRRVA